MDVDDAVSVLPDHGFWQHYQKSGQHHQIRLVAVQLLQEGLVKAFPVLKLLRRNAGSFHAMGFCPLQGISAWVVADHGADVGIGNRSALYPIDDGLEVRASAGDTDNDI